MPMNQLLCEASLQPFNSVFFTSRFLRSCLLFLHFREMREFVEDASLLIFLPGHLFFTRILFVHQVSKICLHLETHQQVIINFVRVKGQLVKRGLNVTGKKLRCSYVHMPFGKPRNNSSAIKTNKNLIVGTVTFLLDLIFLRTRSVFAVDRYCWYKSMQYADSDARLLHKRLRIHLLSFPCNNIAKASEQYTCLTLPVLHLWCFD